MTNLQRIRKERNLSQSQLSEASGVNLRTLQGLEIGRKDINKAAVITVLKLADALECDIRDLMEVE